jgi:hypothetical protein
MEVAAGFAASGMSSWDALTVISCFSTFFESMETSNVVGAA